MVTTATTVGAESPHQPGRIEYETRHDCGITIVLLAAQSAVPADGKGCIKGAVVGAIAGHYAHHHAVLGAIAGCAVGHHLANKKALEEKAARAHPVLPPANH